MAKVNTKAPKNVSTGIFMPVLAHRFRILYGTNAHIEMFSMQTERCSINFTKRTLRIEVQQAVADNGMLSEMCRFMAPDWPSTVYIDLLDGNNEVVRRIAFAGLEPFNHSFSLDYAISAVATHIMEFTFKGVDALEVEPRKRDE